MAHRPKPLTHTMDLRSAHLGSLLCERLSSLLPGVAVLSALAASASAQSTVYGVSYDGTRKMFSLDPADSVATYAEGIDPIPQIYYGLDFDATATELHAITYSIGYYGTVDLVTGALTIEGTSNLPPNQVRSLKAHPDGVTWYALTWANGSTESQLWKTTAGFEAFAPVGGPIVGERLWTLACSAEGDLYSTSVFTDSLYAIDADTGTATVIGGVGYDLNFMQDMDFDWATGKLYATISGSFGVEFVEIDTGTGVASSLGDLSAVTLQATMAVGSPAPPKIEAACELEVVPNSTGVNTLLTGEMTAPGGSGLHLDAFDGPPLQFGFFMIGSGLADPAYPISGGNLCLSLTGGNAIGRYSMVGGGFNSIGQFDASGTFVNMAGTSTTGLGYDVPLNAPLPGMPTLSPGTTWFFQLWHRDGAAGPGISNFSNALCVTF